MHFIKCCMNLLTSFRLNVASKVSTIIRSHVNGSWVRFLFTALPWLCFCFVYVFVVVVLNTVETFKHLCFTEVLS